MNEQTNSLPTALELAGLAAQLSPQRGQERAALITALTLWRTAGDIIADETRREDNLKRLKAGIFNLTPDQWRLETQSFPGGQAGAGIELSKMRFSVDDVAKQLFRDKSTSRAAKLKLFRGLPRASVLFEVPAPLNRVRDSQFPYLTGDGTWTDEEDGFPIHPKNKKRAADYAEQSGHKGMIPAGEVSYVKQLATDLQGSEIDGNLARWAYEVRQRQLSEARKREIPPRRRASRTRDYDDRGIQHKPKFRA